MSTNKIMFNTKKVNKYKPVLKLCCYFLHMVLLIFVEVYGPVNPMGSCQALSVYLTQHLLGRLSPLSD